MSGFSSVKSENMAREGKCMEENVEFMDDYKFKSQG